MPSTVSNKANNCIDLIKVFCILMIAGLHVHPLVDQPTLNFFAQEFLFRSAVPFFLITTGYFFAGMEAKKRSSYLRRLYLLYVLASILYIPIYIKDGIVFILINFVLAYHHLWYLLKVAICIQLMIWFDKKKLKYKYAFILMLPIAIFFDEYCKLTGNSILMLIAERAENVGFISYFRSLPFLLIGDYIRKKEIKVSNAVCLVFFILALIAGFGEAAFLKAHLGTDITNDASIFAWLPAVPMFLFAVRTRSFLSTGASRNLRKSVDIVYIIHIWMLEFCEKILHLRCIPDYCAAVILSFAAAAIFLVIASRVKKSKVS